VNVDPRYRAERQALKTREAVRKNGPVFLPLVKAMVETVRKGGRLLLFGEGRLQLLADHAATDVVGRKHHDRSQLPADVLEPSPDGAAATARCIGPFDSLLSVVGDCEDPFFCSVLEAARKRGAKVLCICIGRSRLEGRADVAIDVPEPRPHRVAGLVAAVLHYVSKLALKELRASPFVRPQRLDEGPRRRKAASTSPPSPSTTASARMHRPGADAFEDTGSVEISFSSALLDPDTERMARLDVPIEYDEAEEEFIPLEESGSYDGVILREGQRIITFRCKRCREPLLAGTEMAGRRGRCPFCDRRVKVPRSQGHPYVAADPLLAQSAREVTSQLAGGDVHLALTPRDGPQRDARLVDVTPEGIEALLPTAEAQGWGPGTEVRVRIDTPAFIEPFTAGFEVERVVDVLKESGERGRVRVLLPLADDATHEQRQRLRRLARLSQEARAGGA
jgi:phosphoheptose isomerase